MVLLSGFPDVNRLFFFLSSLDSCGLFRGQDGPCTDGNES
jgi:hypothetical protein